MKKPTTTMEGCAAGLVGHIREEQLDPSARHIWETGDGVGECSLRRQIAPRL